MTAEQVNVREGTYSLFGETGCFAFDIYKAWNGRGGGSMFRAGVYVKIRDGRKYEIAHKMFAAWDYDSKDIAFNAARKWLRAYLDELGTQMAAAAKTLPDPGCGAKMDGGASDD